MSRESGGPPELPGRARALRGGVSAKKCRNSGNFPEKNVDLVRLLCYSRHYLSDERFCFCALFRALSSITGRQCPPHRAGK